MRKFYLNFLALIISGVLVGNVTFAQVKNADDTIPARDTTFVHLGEDLTDNIPVISLDENDMQDGSTQNVSSLLSAGRDPFLSAASFKFGAVRFRIRGYDADLFGTYMNGAPMENLDNGFTPYGQWGGLNDVMRNRDNAHGLRPTPYAFGDLGGLSYIDTRASYQRKQTSFNYALSNRNYTHRFMATHSTGLNQKGWAFTVSGSRRWADEGYTDGTYYDGWSFFGGVDKRFNDKHLLSLVVFGTPTESGRQGASVKEMLDIAGSNYYNPYWGYQNGKRRNASIAKSFQPIGILSHDWKVNDKMSLMTSAMINVGKRSVSGLDWYNAADPRPDYYRYLPSYYADDSTLSAQIRQELLTDVNKRQINWDALYNANYNSFETVNNVDGVAGKTYSGKRSHYIIENRVINTTKYSLGTTMNVSLKSNIDMTAGINYGGQVNNYYKEVEDLLGGDFYMDINQFGERDFPTNSSAGQNDLNHPNRIVKVGDKLGYNYDIHIKKAGAWIQTIFKFNKIDFFVAGEHTYTRFWRVGNAKVGLFPDNSYGKSKPNDFYNYSFKGGVTYKVDGRNYIFLNGTRMTRAPFFENAYLAPRTRDNVQDNLTSEKINSGELGYVMNAPNLKVRLTGYYTQLNDQMNVLTFYNDEVRNFVNYAISNIDKEHMGIEFGVEAKVYQGLSVNAAAAVGRFRYTSRQEATITQDNSASVLSQNLIYSKNYFVPTPQEAYTVGLDYRSPKFWFLNVNVNHFRNMWLDFNPIRRTAGAVNGIDPSNPLFHQIIDQKELDNQFTVDAFAGYSWLMNRRFPSLKKRHYLVFNIGVNNILNNTNIASGGFEQLRFDFVDRNVDKFPAKLYYAYGINYFASIGLRF